MLCLQGYTIKTLSYRQFFNSWILPAIPAGSYYWYYDDGDLRSCIIDQSKKEPPADEMLRRLHESKPANHSENQDIFNLARRYIHILCPTSVPTLSLSMLILKSASYMGQPARDLVIHRLQLPSSLHKWEHLSCLSRFPVPKIFTRTTPDDEQMWKYELAVY